MHTYEFGHWAQAPIPHFLTHPKLAPHDSTLTLVCLVSLVCVLGLCASSLILAPSTPRVTGRPCTHYTRTHPAPTTWQCRGSSTTVTARRRSMKASSSRASTTARYAPFTPCTAVTGLHPFPRWPGNGFEISFPFKSPLDRHTSYPHVLHVYKYINIHM